MYATVRGKTHQVDILAVLHGIFVCTDDFLVLHDRTVGTCAVDLNQVLINDTTGTDVEVTYLRVTHLAVGQTNVLTACQKLAAGIVLPKAVHIWGGSVENHVTLTLITDSPTVKNHQKCFLCHNLSLLSVFTIIRSNSYAPQACARRFALQSYKFYFKIQLR